MSVAKKNSKSKNELKERRRLYSERNKRERPAAEFLPNIKGFRYDEGRLVKLT